MTPYGDIELDQVNIGSGNDGLLPRSTYPMLTYHQRGPAGRDPGPCLTTAIWRCRKNSSQWRHSFQWKLSSHWLKFLRQRHVAVKRGPALWCPLTTTHTGLSSPSSSSVWSWVPWWSRRARWCSSSWSPWCPWCPPRPGGPPRSPCPRWGGENTPPRLPQASSPWPAPNRVIRSACSWPTMSALKPLTSNRASRRPPPNCNRRASLLANDRTAFKMKAALPLVKRRPGRGVSQLHSIALVYISPKGITWEICS